MWNDRLRLAESVGADWDALSPHERELATEALRRIDDDPIAGVPLFEPLRGLWTFRAGHLRVVYELVADAKYVAILSIARAGDAW